MEEQMVESRLHQQQATEECAACGVKLTRKEAFVHKDIVDGDEEILCERCWEYSNNPFVRYCRLKGII